METVAVKKHVKQVQSESAEEIDASMQRSLEDAVAGRIKPLSFSEEAPSK